MWSLAVLGMAACLVTSVVDVFQLYMSHNLRSDIQQTVSDELPFPAVTLCNLSPFHRTRLNASAALKRFLIANSNLGIFEPPVDFSNAFYAELSEEIPPGWLETVVAGKTDTLLICMFKGDLINCHDLFVERVTDSGVCFTFNSWKHVQQNNGPVKTTYTGSNRGLTVYLNVDQENYVFNENMAAGIKVGIIQ